MSDDKVSTIFCAYFVSELVVWAALSERSYEGIGFFWVARELAKAKADVRRYKKKYTYTSKVEGRRRV